MTHPTPSAMAREAYPSAPDDSADPGGWFTSATRATYAAGIAAERARIAAWLRSHAWSQAHALADSIDPPVPLERYGVPKT